MEQINGKRVLQRKIKDLIDDCPEENIQFPCTVVYCEGMGEPEYVITVEKKFADYFVDRNGQKWQRIT